MNPRHATWIAAAVCYLLIALLTWATMSETTPDGERLGTAFAITLLFGTPLAAAAAILAHRLAGATRGGDTAERIVGLAAAGAQGNRREWAVAMRAELASIDDRRERRRFAVGCAVASIRSGIGRAAWLTALASGTIVAVATFASSRASLAGGQGGILASLGFPALALLFLVPLVAAAGTRSFRIGLVTGGLTLLAVFIATVAVSMFEAARWYHVAGVFIMDGDPPKTGTIDLRTAVLDPLRFMVPIVLLWAPWPVFGASLGARLTRRTRQEETPPTPALV